MTVELRGRRGAEQQESIMRSRNENSICSTLSAVILSDITETPTSRGVTLGFGMVHNVDI